MYREREKLMIFNQRLMEDQAITFRLYNALYRITLSRKKFFIGQDGLDVKYSYSTLEELFNNYTVYGTKLIDSIDDIKIC